MYFLVCINPDTTLSLYSCVCINPDITLSNVFFSMYQYKYNSLNTLSSLPNNGRSAYMYLSTHKAIEFYTLYRAMDETVVHIQLSYILGLILQVKCIDR